MGSSGDLSHSSSSSSTATDDSSKSQSATPSGGQGGKKSGPRSKQKQQRKGEKSSAVATTEEREEGQGEEDGGYHLGHPTAVFRHVQTLATQQELLRTGERGREKEGEKRVGKDEGGREERGGGQTINKRWGQGGWEVIRSRWNCSKNVCNRCVKTQWGSLAFCCGCVCASPMKPLVDFVEF